MAKLFVIALLALCSVWANAGDRPIFESPNGDIRIGADQVFTESGIHIEDGLTVTKEDYAKLKKGEVIPLRFEVRNKRWSSDYAYIIVEEVSLGYITLNGKVIRKIQKENVQKYKQFTPFFPFALLYIIICLLVYGYIGIKEKKTFFARYGDSLAFGIAFVALFSALFSTSWYGTILVAFVTFSNMNPLLFRRDVMIARISGMVAASVCVFYFV